MPDSLRIIVSDAALRDELCAEQPSEAISASAEPAEAGFGETIYPVLVDFGAAALPASVAAGVLANWLTAAWRRRGGPAGAVAGVEAGTRADAVPLSDADVERIARRLRALLEAPEPGEDGDP